MRLPVPGPRARRVVTVVGWALVALLVLGFVPVALVTGTFTAAGAWTAFITAAAIALVVWVAVIRPARKVGLVSPVVQVTDRVAHAVPVPEKVEGPVRACMRCGSQDLALPGLRDGVFLGGGELQFLVCRNCHSRAPPLEFERGEDYVAFLRELEAGRV